MGHLSQGANLLLVHLANVSIGDHDVGCPFVFTPLFFALFFLSFLRLLGALTLLRFALAFLLLRNTVAFALDSIWPSSPITVASDMILVVLAFAIVKQDHISPIMPKFGQNWSNGC